MSKTLEETIEALLTRKLDQELVRAGIPEAGIVVKPSPIGESDLGSSISGICDGMGAGVMDPVFADTRAILTAKLKTRRRAAKAAVPVLEEKVADAKAKEKRSWGLWERYRLRPKRAAEYKAKAEKEAAKAKAVKAGLRAAEAEAISPTITSADIRAAAKPAIKDLATVMARGVRDRTLSSKRAVGAIRRTRRRQTQEMKKHEVTSVSAESFFSPPEWGLGSDVEEGAQAFGQDIDTAAAVFSPPEWRLGSDVEEGAQAFGQDIDTAAAVFGQAGSEESPYVDF